MDNNLIDQSKLMASTLETVSKDIGFLCRKLRKTDSNDESRFMTNLVEASFYLNAIAMAGKSLNKMLQDSQAGDNTKLIHDYFIVEANSLREIHDNKDQDRRQSNGYTLPQGESPASGAGDASSN